MEYCINIKLLKELEKLGFQLNSTCNPHSLDFDNDIDTNERVLLWWFFEADNWVIFSYKNGKEIKNLKSCDLLQTLLELLAISNPPTPVFEGF